MLRQRLFRRPRLNPRTWSSPEFRIASVADQRPQGIARPAVAPPIACRNVGSSTAPKASRASLIPSSTPARSMDFRACPPASSPTLFANALPVSAEVSRSGALAMPSRYRNWQAASSQSAQRSPLPPRPCRQRGPAPHRFPNSRPSLPTAYSEAIAVPMNTAAAVPPPTPAATRTRIPCPPAPNRQPVLLIDSVVGHLARVPPAHSARQAGHHQPRAAARQRSDRRRTSRAAGFQQRARRVLHRADTAP